MAKCHIASDYYEVDDLNGRNLTWFTWCSSESIITCDIEIFDGPSAAPYLE